VGEVVAGISKYEIVADARGAKVHTKEAVVEVLSQRGSVTKCVVLRVVERSQGGAEQRWHGLARKACVFS
jgi:hypothetical protein